ncbi:MAG: ATP synthase F0 subunit B [Acidobacteria bacterium]|nr:ATP synthase F0 subunit B [Acidobacteriota bacterium]
MEATLNALGDLLVKAIPTVIFFIILTVYLKAVLFRPLAKIFEERRKATEGVRELAQRAFEAADKKSSELEHALQIARAELHREREAMRRRWTEQQEQEIAKARAEAERQIEEAKRQIAEEVQKAQSQLDANVEDLSTHIVSSVLRRRAA